MIKQALFKIQKLYGDLKLQSKILVVIILAVTVPVVMLGFFFYGRLYDMVVSYTIRQEQDMSAHIAPLVEEQVQKILDAYALLSSEPFYRTLFTQFSESADDILQEEDALRSFVSRTEEVADGTLITGVRIYAELPDSLSLLYESSGTDNLFLPMSSARGTYWHGIFQGSHASELFCPSFYLGTRENRELGDLAYIRALTLHLNGESYPCYMAVYCSSDPFTAILSENLSLDGSVSYIMNERDSLVASSNVSLSGIYWIDYQTIRSSFMSSNNFIERTILDQKIYAGFYSISQPRWFMVTILPSRPLIRQASMLMIQYVFFYICALLLALLLSSLLARSVTNRISSVISQMSRVREGPPTPLADPIYRDEVGDLIDTYNYMTREMARLMEERGKAAEDLRIAEFNSLQAQMNPHFLYNTMDMINWLAKQGRSDEVSSAVQSLSRFYKLTLSRKKSISTIAQEEEHVSIYIQLQNMRYHDRITFISDVPDELMEYQIPKLTLQPVVENAVLHGILEKESKSGTIVLTGWIEDDDIVLLISDDGVGMNEEKLSGLLLGTGSSTSGGTNIGVYNTHRRIQILYGEKYGLFYTSEPGKSTEVQIHIPAQKQFSGWDPANEAHFDKALTLLADPHLNIYQIARECGYENAEDFFETFRRKFHISPSEYRKQFL